MIADENTGITTMQHQWRLKAAASSAAILATAFGIAHGQAPATAPAAAPPPQTVKITILGVGDMYDFQTGSFAKLNAVAKAEKAANPNTIYVFDGDMLS